MLRSRRRMLAAAVAVVLSSVASAFAFTHPQIGRRTSKHFVHLRDATPVDEWNSWDEPLHARFAAEYWNHKPLLVRGAFPDLATSPLVTPEQLAELACEPGASARLVTDQEQLQFGPFDPSDLPSPAEGHWSLLVNDLERRVPALEAVLQRFNSIPNWRFDDVMVSHANTGSGIGAHVDSYDVFLLQGSGQREWSLQNQAMSPDEEQALLKAGIDVRVLTEWAPTHRWVLEPGDFLYLPPRIPHCGRSLTDDCTTISIGFRLPKQRELVSSFCDFVASELPDLTVGIGGELSSKGAGELSGEIVAEAKSFLRQSLLAALDDDERFATWFGAFSTRPTRLPVLTERAGEEEEEDMWDVEENAEQQDEEDEELETTVAAEQSAADAFLGLLQDEPNTKLVHPLGLCIAHIFFGASGEDGGAVLADGAAVPFPAALLQVVPQLTRRGAVLNAGVVKQWADDAATAQPFRALLSELLDLGVLVLLDEEGHSSATDGS